MRFLLLLYAALPLAGQQPALHLDLAGPWRFHSGDAPEFAAPDFDDSSWETITIPRTGRQPMDYWWLRLAVDLPERADASQLAITVGGVNEIYEVFVNGARIAAVGEQRRFSDTFVARPRTFALPPGLIANGPAHRRVTLAVRLWYSGFISPYVRDMILYPDTGPWLLTYRANAPRNVASDAMARRERGSIPNLVASIFEGVLALLLLLGWLMHRDRRDLLIFAGFLLSEVLLTGYDFVSLVGDWSQLSNFWSAPGITLCPLFLAYFTTQALGIRGRWLVIAAWASFLLHVIELGILAKTNRVMLGWQHMVWVLQFVDLLIIAVAVQAVWRGVRRKNAQGMALPAAIAVIAILHAQMFSLLRLRSAQFSIHGMTWSLYHLLLMATALAMTVQLIRNLGAARQRLAGEMEAARSVQQLLLADSSPATQTAWKIEASYLPAQEVGGDFYTILDRMDGSRLVVTGDVSGKGLPAALLVSVAIGILRNEKSSSPAAILSALNEGLTGHTRGGFVTCCCARFELDGSVTIANAGHPPPYCEREVEIEPGLPLGIAPGVAYAEKSVRGDRFTFVSDGVVEAASAKGELFGFARTQEVSGKSAQAIAEIARSWGQNDDITVVTVLRLQS